MNQTTCKICGAALKPYEDRAKGWPCLLCCEGMAAYITSAKQAINKKPEPEPSPEGEAPQESKAGGARAGAGRKSGWETEGPTKVLRVPEALAEQVTSYARRLDAGGTIPVGDSTNDDTVRSASAILALELAWLGEDRKRKARTTTLKEVLAALEHYQAN